MILKWFLTYFMAICVALVILEIPYTEGIKKTKKKNYGKMRELQLKASQLERKVRGRVVRSNDFNSFDHQCKRNCELNQPLTCYYYMVVQYDMTMGEACNQYMNVNEQFHVNDVRYINSYKLSSNKSLMNDCKYGDGVETEIVVVNSQFPGQSIEVCQGDTIVADIINNLREPTTVHWHGMHQLQTPHMDGVPHITQYPIEPGQAYRYRFEVDHEGTNWWHSHTNRQREVGMAGPLIVRQPPSINLHANAYDIDQTGHIILIQDWRYNSELTTAENILINGFGRNINPKGNQNRVPTFYATFNVIRGARYRFRVIYNGVTNCPITFSIDNHKLVVISSDGNDIQPLEVDSIVFNAGERYDFVLHANQDNRNFWMRVKGHHFCATRKVHQEAILHYQGADTNSLPDGDEPSYYYDPMGIQLNPFDKITSEEGSHITVNDMSTAQSGSQITVKPSYTHYTSMSVKIDNEALFQMDDISFTMPKLSLLQSRNLGIGNLFCNKTQQQIKGLNCQNSHCSCLNVINVPAFRTVEFVISSESSTSHPIHLHGYTFRIVGMGALGEDDIRQIAQIDRKTPLPRRREGAPLKDTVHVPAFGYVIVQFYTNSPGYWLFHCHISPHAENGMTSVIRVGQDMEMKMCPVSNCALCDSTF